MCLKPIPRILLATAFNNVFVSIRESLAEAFVDGEAFVFECRVPNNISYKFPKVESSYVLKELKGMSANNATGIDGITSCSLKAEAPVICDSVAFIMNFSIFIGLFINDSKVAKVIPLYKSCNTSEVSNYWRIIPYQYYQFQVRFWNDIFIQHFMTILNQIIWLLFTIQA